jgi:uncharacterized protein involved in exopolysaccharide biosynthesis
MTHPELLTDSWRPPTAADDVDVITFLTTLLRWRRVVLVFMLVITALVLAPAFLLGREFVSTASFLPEQRSASPVSGLAAQFGIAVPTDASGQSPAFYEDLAKSRAILGRIVDDTTRFADNGTPRSLEELLNVHASSPALQRESALTRLTSAVTAATNSKTGIVSVRVRTRSPRLSQWIAQRVLDELASFNRERRLTNATKERRFAQARFAEATSELTAAENALQGFLERNKGDLRQSPNLAFEHDRLARQVSLKTQAQATLAESLERARLDEARDAPVFTVIDAPEIPPLPESRGIVLRAIIGLSLGLFLGVLFAFVLDSTRSASLRGEAAFVEFQQVRREALGSLARPLRRTREGQPNN